MLCAGAAILTLGACDVKDPIYNTLHPGHGTITLTADWSGIGQGLTAPESYTVRAGDYTATVGRATAALDHLFEPGKYVIHACNTAEHITVGGTTATVAVASGNVDGVGAFIHNAPEWFFTCATEAAIEADTDHPSPP